MIRPAVYLAILFCLGACATSQPPAEPPPDVRFGAPVAVAPRDVRSYGADPCAGPLTASDWESLGLTRSGSVKTLMTGERLCDRGGPNRERDVSFIVIPARDVLVDTYRTRQFALFRPTTVGGLPATVEQSSEDSISCTITVGTAQDQGFVVDQNEYGQGQPDDPCGRAQQVAERIVAALPPLPGK
ncbi:DUF3558 domain-containing protein [Actinomycetospora flava]|uniref:DUF3558 domain-containing protein n=1 Tax=Actinomycetospora flava TaxID=3129232 RepID=A0ABU8M8K9_9PSEU